MPSKEAGSGGIGAGLCDLEFRDAQELMREQAENVKSVNLVAEVTQLLAILYTNLDAQHLPLIAEILETLIEMTQVLALLKFVSRFGRALVEHLEKRKVLGSNT